MGDSTFDKSETMTKNSTESRGAVLSTLSKDKSAVTKKFRFERVHDVRLAGILKRSFLGQKRTAKHKPLVFIDPVSKRVFKGPYKHGADDARVRRAAFRSALFGDAWKGNVCRYRKLVSACGPCMALPFEYYIEFKHVTGIVPRIGGQRTNILGLEKPAIVLDKASQRFSELSMALDSTTDIADAVLAAAFVHYVHCYVCDPIVGDASLRNVLVTHARGGGAVGIDFEDNRATHKDAGPLYNASGIRGSTSRDGLLYAMLSGGKRWSESKWRKLVDATARRKVQVLTALELIGETLRDGTVAGLVEQHGVGHETDIARMSLRYRELLRELQALWPNVDAAAGARL